MSMVTNKSMNADCYFLHSLLSIAVSTVFTAESACELFYSREQKKISQCGVVTAAHTPDEINITQTTILGQNELCE